MKIYDEVLLKKGTKIGAGTLKADVKGEIAQIDGDMICIRFVDRIGRERTTWKTIEEVQSR